MGLEIKEELLELFREHRGACLGLLAGMLVGVAVLCFGFFRTAFVLLLGAVGWWLGREHDQKADALSDFRDVLARLLPARFGGYRGRDEYYY